MSATESNTQTAAAAEQPLAVPADEAAIERLLQAQDVASWCQIHSETVRCWLADTEPGAHACMEGILKCMAEQHAAALQVLSGAPFAALKKCTCGLCDIAAG